MRSRSVTPCGVKSGNQFGPASAKNDELVSQVDPEHRIAGCHSIDRRTSLGSCKTDGRPEIWTTLRTHVYGRLNETFSNFCLENRDAAARRVLLMSLRRHKEIYPNEQGADPAADASMLVGRVSSWLFLDGLLSSSPPLLHQPSRSCSRANPLGKLLGKINKML